MTHLVDRTLRRGIAWHTCSHLFHAPMLLARTFGMLAALSLSASAQSGSTRIDPNAGPFGKFRVNQLCAEVLPLPSEVRNVRQYGVSLYACAAPSRGTSFVMADDEGGESISRTRGDAGTKGIVGNNFSFSDMTWHLGSQTDVIDKRGTVLLRAGKSYALRRLPSRRNGTSGAPIFEEAVVGSKGPSSAPLAQMARPPAPLTQIDPCLVYKCEYAAIRIERATALREQPDASSRAVAETTPGDQYTPDNFAAVTTTPGYYEVTEPFSIGDVPHALKKGERIYTYHHWGEGCYTVWAGGKLYGHEKPKEPTMLISQRGNGCISLMEHTKSVAESVSEGWYRVQLKNGRKAWLQADSTVFSWVP